MRISTPGDGTPTVSERHLAVGLLGDEHAGLGLAVELLEVDPERPVEIEDLGADRLSGRIADAHAGEPERVLQRPVDQHVAQAVAHPVPGAHRLAVEEPRPDAARVLHEAVEQPPLGAARVLHANHDGGELALEHAGRREVVGRADLAQIHYQCVRALGAVDAEARGERLADREDEIADPGHRQVGQQPRRSRVDGRTRRCCARSPGCWRSTAPRPWACQSCPRCRA